MTLLFGTCFYPYEGKSASTFYSRIMESIQTSRGIVNCFTEVIFMVMFWTKQKTNRLTAAARNVKTALAD